MSAIAFTIIIDTREQAPLSFPADVAVRRAKLAYGDYQIGNGPKYEPGAVVERKSHADAWQSVLRGRARFQREWGNLAALRSAGHTVAVLIECADWDALARPPTSHANPARAASVVATYRAWSAKYGVPVVFAASREAAAAWIYETFKAIEESRMAKP